MKEFQCPNYDGRLVDLILHSVQRPLSHLLVLSESIPSSLYILVYDVPSIEPVMASAALYRTLSILPQNESSLVGHITSS